MYNLPVQGLWHLRRKPTFIYDLFQSRFVITAMKII